MKVLLLGDQHFGAGYNFGRPDPKTGINSRLLDYERTAANVVSYAIENKVDLFVFLGDTFEARTPTSQQIVVFYRQLKRLSAAKIMTYAITGNHDQSKARNISSSLDPIKEVHMPYINIFTGIDLATFTNKQGESLNVLLVPYRNRHSYDRMSNEEALGDMTQEIETAVNKAIPGAPLLVCSHMMMEGTIPSDAGDYGSNELILPFEMFKGADVVVNGHIHRKSILREDPLFIYSGSMECKDFSEKDHKKCFLIYDSTKKGLDSMTFEPIPTRKFVDFDIDFSVNWPDDPMKDIAEQFAKVDLKEAVVRCSIRVPEVKMAAINLMNVRAKLYEYGVSVIADASVSPVISRQLRHQNVNDAPDDVSAFKHFVAAQTNVALDVLDKGLAIMTGHDK